MELQIVNTETGEKFDIEKATPQQISDYYIDLNTKVKQLEKLRKEIDKFVKDKLVFKEDDDGKERANFGDLNYLRAYRRGVNKKALEANEDDQETYDTAKAVIDDLTEKYLQLTGYIRITK